MINDLRFWGMRHDGRVLVRTNECTQRFGKAGVIVSMGAFLPGLDCLTCQANIP